MLLEGEAHAYVFASGGSKKWDTCAPEAVLEAAGGVLTDMHGVKYSYAQDVCYPNKTGIFATAPGISHSCLRKKIPQDLLESLK